MPMRFLILVNINGKTEMETLLVKANSLGFGFQYIFKKLK
jgi:hypothetical protein